MTVGKKIFVARRASGLSLRDLSERIDNRVSAQAISKYEREESTPSSEVLYSISDALGVTPGYLSSDQEICLEAVDFRRKRLTSKREESQVKAACQATPTAVSDGGREIGVSDHQPEFSARSSMAYSP